MIATVDGLADWTEFVPFAEAPLIAPLLPGVYLVRSAAVPDQIVYVGMAGERVGSGRPQGLRGRLRVYASGKAAVSGLGEAVMDRALARPSFLLARVKDAERGQSATVKGLCRLAFEWAVVEVAWATTPTKDNALRLERATLDALSTGSLWNKARQATTRQWHGDGLSEVVGVCIRHRSVLGVGPFIRPCVIWLLVSQIVQADLAEGAQAPSSLRGRSGPCDALGLFGGRQRALGWFEHQLGVLVDLLLELIDQLLQADKFTGIIRSRHTDAFKHRKDRPDTGCAQAQLCRDVTFRLSSSRRNPAAQVTARRT